MNACFKTIKLIVRLHFKSKSLHPNWQHQLLRIVYRQSFEDTRHQLWRINGNARLKNTNTRDDLSYGQLVMVQTFLISCGKRKEAAKHDYFVLSCCLCCPLFLLLARFSHIIRFFTYEANNIGKTYRSIYFVNLALSNWSLLWSIDQTPTPSINPHLAQTRDHIKMWCGPGPVERWVQYNYTN